MDIIQRLRFGFPVLHNDKMKTIDSYYDLCLDASKEIESLRAKLVEAEKDVGRYKYLINALCDNEAWAYDLIESMYNVPHESANKIIDAAIAKQKGKQ